MHSTLDAFPRALTQWTLMTSLGPFWFHQMNKNENKQLSYFNLKKKKKRYSKIFIKPPPIWRSIWLREKGIGCTMDGKNSLPHAPLPDI